MAQSAAPRPPSLSLCPSVSSSLALLLSRSLHLTLPSYLCLSSLSVRCALLLIEGPRAPPFSAWGAPLCTCDIGGIYMCVLGEGGFRPSEEGQSYDLAEDSHLQLCLKQWESH